MAKLSKNILLKMVERGFFDEWKTMKDIARRLAQRGHNIKPNKRGLVAQLLTFLCQDDVLERERLPKSDWEQEMGQWKYKKVIE